MRLIVAAFLFVSASLTTACSSRSTATDPAAPVTTSPAAPAATVSRFHGAAGVASLQMDVSFGAPTASRGIVVEASLPYGNLCNQVYLHTVPGSVHWEGSCGALTLCGQVELVNNYPGPISSATAVIDSVSATGVTATGSPYVYGTVDAHSTSAPITWSFSDTTSTDFTFSGHVDGIAPAVGLTSSPQCQDFGNVVIYTAPAPQQLFTITNNTGAATGTLIAVLSSGGMPGFSLTGNTCDSKSLGAGASCTVGVQLDTSNGGFTTSPGVGHKTNALSVTDSSSPGTGVLVSLDGTLTCGPKGNQCIVDGDCCSGSCNVPTTPFCN